MARPYNPGDPAVWTALVAILGSIYLIARAVTWMAMSMALIPWKRAAKMHWSERARRAWPARRLGRLSLFLVVIPLVFAAGRDGRRIALFPEAVTLFLLVIAASAGVLHNRIRFERRLCPAMALTPRAERAAWISNLGRGRGRCWRWRSCSTG